MREYSQLTDEQRTALKGRPQLGEVTSITIRLKESKEFKVKFTYNALKQRLIMLSRTLSTS